MPIGSSGRRTVASTISTATSSARWTISPRSGAASSIGSGTAVPQEDGYFTTLIGNEAVNIINNHDTAKPLFLYVASLAPHAPYQAPKADIDAYKNAAGDVHRHTYAAMITDLDTQVGRIVAVLFLS